MEDENTTATDNLNTVRDRLKRLETILNKYIELKGIYSGPIKNQSDYERCISLSYDDVKKMGAEDRQATAATLAQFSFFIQRDFNQEIMRLHWAESQIDKIVARTTKQYDKFSPYAERRNLAIAEDEVASKLNEIKIYAQARVDILNELSYRINEIQRTLKREYRDFQ